MKNFLICFIVLFSANAFSQKKDNSFFKEYEPGFYQNSILKDIRNVNKKLEKVKMTKYFKVDMSKKDLPNKVDFYKKNMVWHFPVISQGNAGSCWAYSTVSFLESEVKRISNQEVKISEPYIVYWEYVEKAKGFIKKRGKSLFGQGSEGNAVTRMMKKYGAVPLESYTGLKDGRKFHTHEKMFNEMFSYLKSVKRANAWNEVEIIATIKSIMDTYIGTPPEEFSFKGKKYTPKTFLKDILKIKPEDYVEVLSYKQAAFYKKTSYDVPDNWWKSEEYYNIPLDEFMRVLKKAIRNGYTVSIGGDVSEAGLDTKTQCAIVPTFDLPSDYIDDNSRQFRFSNMTTTDDHGMHLVSYFEKDGKDWYLIKDSSSGSRNNDENSKEFGYYFFSEDYVKLKMMGFTIHKDALKDILKKFK
ncbi:MAG: peptidase C1 [Bacteroidetes bacterium 4572_128]|nr:MAG: peptidase C1 [Bacteroidetes bacterium 4572_128]